MDKNSAPNPKVKEEIPVPPNDKDTEKKPAPPDDKTKEEISVSEKKKKKTKYILLFSAGGAVLLLLLIFVAGTLLYPFSASKEQVKVYIFNGESAKTEVKFTNKRSSDKVLILNCGDHGILSETISGGETQPVTLEFPSITKDTTIIAKYGFLKMKKLEIKVVVAESSQFRLADVRIAQGNGIDITEKQYCPPNKKITFNLNAYNDSEKDFNRNYSLKINGKTVDTKTAFWIGEQQQKTELQYEYVFKKQGYYKIELDGIKINFICSTNDKPPSNGTFLRKKISGGRGVLKLQNKYKHPVIITLCRSSAPNKALNRIYIKTKNSVTMHGIKDGSYIVYVKGGKGYSKMAKDILNTKVAYKSSGKMKFTTTSRTYSIWTLKIGVSGGNTGTSPIDKNSIPM